ncbi:unnamed protein product, partial [Mesorhabditis belari]|uniref:Neurotransmitter-gated ion-channel ligand-binding domain-containing protein n=1 Tax=Mesorhabditis belari TaxID=2138241 RepID=A0AAF3F618_9BILA
MFWLAVFLLYNVEAFNHAGKLLEGYEKRVTPWEINNETLFVNFSTPLMRIVEVKNQGEVITMLIDIELEWFDKRLTFDPAKYGNRSFLYLPICDVTTPPYSILGNVARSYFETKNDFIRISPNGKIYLRDSYQADVLCQTNPENFPYDIEFCGVYLINYMVNLTEMQYIGKMSEAAVLRGNYELWMTNYTIMSASNRNLTYTPEVRFYMTFERRTVYYALVINFPSFLVTTLTITGILFPQKHENASDPINIGLCAFLALSVMLTVVADNLPKTDAFSGLSLYILICLIICIMSVVFGFILDWLYVTCGQKKKPEGEDEKEREVRKKSCCTVKRTVNIISLLLFVAFEAILILMTLAFSSLAQDQKSYSIVENLTEVATYDIFHATKDDLESLGFI